MVACRGGVRESPMWAIAAAVVSSIMVTLALAGLWMRIWRMREDRSPSRSVTPAAWPKGVMNK
jgi:hypothetical protein